MSVPVTPGDPRNLVAFPSGAGDGGYPGWVGRTADGVAMAFLVDFAILAHPVGWQPTPTPSPTPTPMP